MNFDPKLLPGDVRTIYVLLHFFYRKRKQLWKNLFTVFDTDRVDMLLSRIFDENQAKSRIP